jgi:hypothetical protein
LKKNGIDPKKEDKLVGIYEKDSDFPHLLYYQVAKKKIHLFQFLSLEGEDKNMKKKIQ